MSKVGSKHGGKGSTTLDRYNETLIHNFLRDCMKIINVGE